MRELCPYRKFPGCEQLPELLLQCTEPQFHGRKYQIDLPWVLGNFVYATDGRIIARMPIKGLKKPLVQFLRDMTTRCVPNALPVYVGEFEDKPTKLPKIEDPRIECDTCNGKGYVTTACPICRPGTPDWKPECPGCKGTKERVYGCEKCEMDGWVYQDTDRWCPVGWVAIAQNYLYLLQTNGVKEVFEPKQAPEPAAVKWVKDNIEGRLMPSSRTAAEVRKERRRKRA